ncbi:MAG: T9SS type A sorting domain-containing protein [Bacteroidota bacterium]|nr:T9SS type A sorting domain-containing protein [Bacteroidota bacterium]
MKTLIKVLIIILIFGFVAEAQSQYSYRTIREIQYNSPDSLSLAEYLQNSQPSRYTLQGSRFMGDTVTVVGVCVIPAQVLKFTAGGYTMVIADTGYDGNFGSIFIRASIATGDTASYIEMLNPGVGDIVRVVGYIAEFGTPGMNTVTQLVPLRSPNFTLIGAGEISTIKQKNIFDFYEGIFPGGRIKFRTGEPLESGIVELTNLTVVSALSATNGTVNLVDDLGNMISTYDGSTWFTLRTYRDPLSTYQLPEINSRIDTLRGMITSVSGGENPRGYRITPIFPGDIIFGKPRPIITTVRRYPVVVTQDSATKIEAIFTKLKDGATIKERFLLYSIDNASFTLIEMNAVSGDTLYRGIIPIQSIGTNVRYFLKAVDSLGLSTISASGAGGGLGSDTSKGFYFYKVTDGNLTIQDIQFTPYSNGRSAYVGAVTKLRGIITADTSDIGLTARTTGGTSVWYMQSGNNLASGIWFTGVLDTLKSLKKGDSVAITGTIQENFDVTRIGNVTLLERFTPDNPIPNPTMLTTGIFGPGAGNGDLNAEPYEGMLVQFDTVTVTNVWPTFADVTEYSVSDGSGDIIVRRDGKNTYSNVIGDTIFNMTIIKVGDRFANLKGIIYYSFNRYKVCPRTNADFGTFLPLNVDDRIDGPLPTQYQLSNNYPNPFNPKTVIEYSIPREEFVTLKIYNLIGQEVATLKNEIQKAGSYRVNFDGSKLSSGIYFYRLQTSSFTQIKKMALVK